MEAIFAKDSFGLKFSIREKNDQIVEKFGRIESIITYRHQNPGSYMDFDTRIDLLILLVAIYHSLLEDLPAAEKTDFHDELACIFPISS